MKVGIVTEYFYPTVGGITENIYHFARRLLDYGHDFRIITSYAGRASGLCADVQERVVYVGRAVKVFFNNSCGRVSVGTGLAKKLQAIFEKEKFDIIHLHSPQYPTLPILAILYQNCPAVGTFHTCVKPHSIYQFYYKLVSPILARLAGSIAVSKVCANESKVYYNLNGNVEVIPNGVDVGWWSKPRACPTFMQPHRKRIVFLGRPDMRNGLDTLIDAMEIVRQRRPEAHLFVVGDGPLAFYYKRYARKIRGSVTFLGSVNEERPAILQYADVMCFLPDVASFGITVLEGMASRAPMVLTDLPAFRELVRPGLDACLVPPRSPTAVAEAITRLLSNVEHAKEMAASAYARSTNYDWSIVSKRIIEFYKRILSF